VKTEAVFVVQQWDFQQLQAQLNQHFATKSMVNQEKKT
jgi:hypothetical protein